MTETQIPFAVDDRLSWIDDTSFRRRFGYLTGIDVEGGVAVIEADDPYQPDVLYIPLDRLDGRYELAPKKDPLAHLPPEQREAGNRRVLAALFPETVHG